jgi:hypothetical protein
MYYLVPASLTPEDPMSTLSFLAGLPTSDAVYTSEGTEDIAYANDWVPVGCVFGERAGADNFV